MKKVLEIEAVGFDRVIRDAFFILQPAAPTRQSVDHFGGKGEDCDVCGHADTLMTFLLPPKKSLSFRINALFVLHKMRVYAESHWVFLGREKQMGFRINSHFFKKEQKSEFSGMTGDF